MSKEQTIVELNVVETAVEAPAAEIQTLSDLSLALVGGGNYVVAL